MIELLLLLGCQVDAVQSACQRNEAGVTQSQCYDAAWEAAYEYGFYEGQRKGTEDGSKTCEDTGDTADTGDTGATTEVIGVCADPGTPLHDAMLERRAAARLRRR